MKFLCFLFLLVLSFNLNSQIRAITNAQSKLISEREFNKYNHIKTQMIAILPDKNSQFADGSLTKINYFEQDGKLIYTSDYEAFSDSTGTTYSYFQDGYLHSVKKVASESNQLLIAYDYDSLGFIKRITNNGAEFKEFDCFYDKNYNLIKKLGYIYYPKTDDSGFVKPNYHERLLVDEFIYKYDKKNNLIEEITKINGKLINKTKLKYNKQNLKTEELNQYLGNKVKYIYFYSENNLLTDIVRVNIDGSKSYFKVEYNYYK